ncbi:MAG: hypothetical protein KDB58_09170 [Solirubrobacterales bacterium]|nr:hypothetical protein [Solirubrobacterales bacterium]MCB8971065.1 hypothetical protein [Thermoleophilales bacterium]MCO5326040.1 hypothetical protein [Solirubrobacterales bacterium]
MDGGLAIRAGALQAAAVALLSIVLALALPHSFFEDWGWLSGPAAWLLCALFTATALALPRGPALLGAVLVGLPSIIAVIIGVHWLGALVAVILFALWCGRLEPRGEPVGLL